MRVSRLDHFTIGGDASNGRFLNNEGVHSASTIEAHIALTGTSNPAAVRSIGMRSDLTCPDRDSVMCTIGASGPLRYRCNTGHAFSGISLADAQCRQSENALWSLVRGFQERVSISNELLATAESDQTAELQRESSDSRRRKKQSWIS